MTLGELELELAKRGAGMMLQRHDGRWLVLIKGTVSRDEDLEKAIRNAIGRFDEKLTQSYCKGTA